MVKALASHEVSVHNDSKRTISSLPKPEWEIPGFLRLAELLNCPAHRLKKHRPVRSKHQREIQDSFNWIVGIAIGWGESD
jgi:hypothetical protein